jgi:hypothetical protein
VVIFSSAEVSCRTPTQRVAMDQGALVALSLAGGTWLHHPDTSPYGPLSGAAKTPLGPDQVNIQINIMLAKHRVVARQTEACVKFSNHEDQPHKRARIPISISAEGLDSFTIQEAIPITHVRLHLYGERRFTIEIPESISRMGLRRVASQYFKGRVRTIPDSFPPKDDTIVNCIP